MLVQGLVSRGLGHEKQGPLPAPTSAAALRYSGALSAPRSLVQQSHTLSAPALHEGPVSPSPTEVVTPPPLSALHKQIIDTASHRLPAEGTHASQADSRGPTVQPSPSAAANTAFLAAVQTTKAATGVVERTLRDNSSPLATINWLAEDSSLKQCYHKSNKSNAVPNGTLLAWVGGAGQHRSFATKLHDPGRSEAGFEEAIANVLAATTAADSALSDHQQQGTSDVLATAVAADQRLAIVGSLASGSFTAASAAFASALTTAAPAAEETPSLLPEMRAHPFLLRPRQKGLLEEPTTPGTLSPGRCTLHAQMS